MSRTPDHAGFRRDVARFAAVRAHASAPVRTLVSRNVRALYAGRPIVLEGAPAAGNRAATVWALDGDGALALSAEIEFG